MELTFTQPKKKSNLTSLSQKPEMTFTEQKIKINFHSAEKSRYTFSLQMLENRLIVMEQNAFNSFQVFVIYWHKLFFSFSNFLTTTRKSG